jgi:hypothetical protein
MSQLQNSATTQNSHDTVDPRFFATVPIFDGGPLDRVLNRLNLGGNSYQKVFHRFLLCVAVTWFPLSVLSWIGSLTSSRVPKVPFIFDFSLHVRFLIAIGILVASEFMVNLRIKNTISLLINYGIIRNESIPQLVRIKAWIQSLRDSVITEVIVLFLAIGIVLSRRLLDLPHEITSWRNLGTLGSHLAREWYQWISLVIYHFLLLRWIWRYILWSLLLFRISKLNLCLQSHHPDRMGGLSVILARHVNFGVIALVVSSVMSANVAETVIYAGARVELYQFPLMVYLLIIGCVFLVPLAVFTPALERTKREGLIRYGHFANRYAFLFDDKWLIADPKVDMKDVLGSPDIQALNDLGGSYTHLREMRLFLMDRRHLLGLIAFGVLPLLPLIAFKIPLFELMKSLVKVFV